jgi:hypothetical protein
MAKSKITSGVRPHVFQDIADKRLGLIEERIENLSNAHIRLQSVLIAYIQKTEKISEEKAMKLFDDLSMLHGKIVALKK